MHCTLLYLFSFEGVPQKLTFVVLQKIKRAFPELRFCTLTDDYIAKVFLIVKNPTS